MMLMVCKKCGCELEEPGMLSQSFWIWPVFGAFPAFFLGYYWYTVFQNWGVRLRWISAIAVFATVLVAAIYFLRRYCRNLEYEHLRHRRCPDCNHTHWEYREVRKGEGASGV